MISHATRIGVLAFDDEPEVAGYLCGILHDASYHCTVADSPAADLQALTPVAASARPAGAIVDLVLGDANGLAIAKELVARDPAVRILLISGLTDVMSDPIRPAVWCPPFAPPVARGARGGGSRGGDRPGRIAADQAPRCHRLPRPRTAIYRHCRSLEKNVAVS